jgi:hypothetical protein
VSVVRAAPHFTILFEDGEGDWIVASVPEVPGAHSQGRTRDEDLVFESEGRSVQGRRVSTSSKLGVIGSSPVLPTW